MNTKAGPGTASAGVEHRARSSWSVSGVTVAAMLIAGCVAAVLTALAPVDAPIPGLPEASPVIGWALTAVRVLFQLSAAVTVGWLLAAAWLVPPQRTRVLDIGGYRAVRAASLAAAVWAVAAVALIPLTLADTLGQPLSKAVSPELLLAGVSVLESVQGLLVTAVIAALIAVLARAVLHPAGAVWLLAAALVAVIPQALAGHTAQSRDHDIAVDSMIYHLLGMCLWVGGLIAVLGLARQGVRHLDVITRRYSAVAFVAFVAVAASGLLNAVVRLTGPGDLWATGYGRLVLAKALLLLALGGFGWAQRRRILPALAGPGDHRRSFLRLALIEIGVLAATIGVATALSRTATPPPPGGVTAPSDLTLLLGYDLAGPPTLARIVTEWRFDWILGVAAIVTAGVYVVGVLRLRRRGHTWPTGRIVAWLSGCLLMLLVTSSGLGRYAETQFSLHMTAHMLLGMVVPALLVLGGPATLALRVLTPAGPTRPPGLREAILAALHSRPARLITHPLVVLALFIGSFAAVYFTGLFGILVASHIGHLVMNVHFLLVGYLYYWVVIGIDPTPRRLPWLAKLGILMAPLPFHAFFGVATMSSRTAMAENYYQSLGLPWVTDLVADQKVGGAIAWAGTEAPIVIVIIALIAQWARSDDRDSRRADRRGATRADAELDAYNRMLTQLADQDRRIP